MDISGLALQSSNPRQMKHSEHTKQKPRGDLKRYTTVERAKQLIVIAMLDESLLWLNLKSGKENEYYHVSLMYATVEQSLSQTSFALMSH